MLAGYVLDVSIAMTQQWQSVGNAGIESFISVLFTFILRT